MEDANKPDTSDYRDGCCTFCLKVVKYPYPDCCPGCGIVRCMNCATFIKGANPGFCYGCGTMMPKAKSQFVRVSSTGMVYMEEEWCDRNKGRHSDGRYFIGTGYVYKNADGGIDMTRTGSVISKQTLDENRQFKYEDVRILTEYERGLINKRKDPNEPGTIQSN